MDTIQRTRHVLAEAEKALASLASEAAKCTQYDVASCLIETARELNVLAARALQRLGNALADKAATSLPAEANESSKPLVTAARSEKRAKSHKSSYPKFLRQGDEMVKIGWSPSEKAEYEHKCPKNVLPLLATAISKAGMNGKRFVMDRIVPLQDSGDGRRIPDYQVYLCLAWLRELGVVIQHGRQGYSLASKAPIEPLLETHWVKLPVR